MVCFSDSFSRDRLVVRRGGRLPPPSSVRRLQDVFGDSPELSHLAALRQHGVQVGNAPGISPRQV
jgi:hypothetical protein